MKRNIYPFGAYRIPSRTASLSLIFLTLLAASACTANQIDKNRSEVLKQYEAMVRWSQWDAALGFMAPEYLEEHPITRLDMDRLRLFRVTQYTLRSARLENDGTTLFQTVEIRMFNNNQAVERTIVDEQEWRYDKRAQSWRLYSGLPDPTRR
jgi:hypothetical protein